MKRIACMAAFLLLTVLPAAADTVSVDVTDIKAIELHPGVNEVAQMLPDQRDGQIVVATRENSNANGYTIYLAMAQGTVIGVADSSGFTDAVMDQPHASEDAVKSVRFAWGKVGGEKIFLLITAKRDLKRGATFADPAFVVFDIYRLATNGQAGMTGTYFAPTSEFRSKKKYCNSDLALTQNLGLPLPQPFEGSNQDDGCL